eukprot:11826613-Alexandrium_andersonii.AAC.1
MHNGACAAAASNSEQSRAESFLWRVAPWLCHPWPVQPVRATGGGAALNAGRQMHTRVRLGTGERRNSQGHRFAREIHG